MSSLISWKIPTFCQVAVSKQRLELSGTCSYFQCQLKTSGIIACVGAVNCASTLPLILANLLSLQPYSCTQFWWDRQMWMCLFTWQYKNRNAGCVWKNALLSAEIHFGMFIQSKARGKEDINDLIRVLTHAHSMIEDCFCGMWKICCLHIWLIALVSVSHLLTSGGWLFRMNVWEASAYWTFMTRHQTAAKSSGSVSLCVLSHSHFQFEAPAHSHWIYVYWEYNIIQAQI